MKNLNGIKSIVLALTVLAGANAHSYSHTSTSTLKAEKYICNVTDAQNTLSTRFYVESSLTETSSASDHTAKLWRAQELLVAEIGKLSQTEGKVSEPLAQNISNQLMSQIDDNNLLIEKAMNNNLWITSSTIVDSSLHFGFGNIFMQFRQGQLPLKTQILDLSDLKQDSEIAFNVVFDPHALVPHHYAEQASIALKTRLHLSKNSQNKLNISIQLNADQVTDAMTKQYSPFRLQPFAEGTDLGTVSGTCESI